MPNSKNRDLGFSFIELLLVVSILGILSGVILTVINPQLQGNRAKDAVKISNVGKLAQALEAHFISEGSYPAAWSDFVASPYVQSHPGSAYGYRYDASVNTACIAIGMSTSSKRIKYVTGTTPLTPDDSLRRKVLYNCDFGCNFGPTEIIKVDGCVALQ